MPKKLPVSKEFLPDDTLHKLETPGADVYYLANFCSPELTDCYFGQLEQMEGWLQRPIMVFGRPCQQNRKTIYFGETGTNYRYSGIDNPGDGRVPDVLRTLTVQVETYLRDRGLLGLEDHFNYYWAHDRLDSINTGSYIDDLPRRLKIQVTTGYLFADIFKQFRRFFMVESVHDARFL